MNLLESPFFLQLGSIAPGWIFALVVGFALMLVAWSAMAATASFVNPIRRRLRLVQGQENLLDHEPAGGEYGFLDRMQPWLASQGNAQQENLQLCLIQAGYRSRKALPILLLAKLLLAVALPSLALVALLNWPGKQPSLGMVGLILAGMLLLGHRLPNVFVEKRRRQRVQQLLGSLPDALDLLVACTEAGLSLPAALERVAEQMPMSDPELAAELAQVNAEMRAGIERNEALRGLAERNGLVEVRGLVSLIAHAGRMGTGIAGTLRIYSEEFRDRRMQRAEEQAAKVGTQLIFPLCFCIFPAFFIVATGPAVVGVLRVLSGTDFPHG